MFEFIPSNEAAKLFFSFNYTINGKKVVMIRALHKTNAMVPGDKFKRFVFEEDAEEAIRYLNEYDVDDYAKDHWEKMDMMWAMF